MRAILRRVPSADDISRNSAKIGGFFTGIVLPLILAALFVVAYTGHGLGESPAPPPAIYPNF